MTTTISRFSLCQANALPSPGQCACCGANDRDAIHWGHDEDFVGVFLLCVNCVREAATQFEPAETPDLTAALELIADLTNELEKVRGILADTAGNIAASNVAFRTRTSLMDSSLSMANGARKG